MEQRRSSLPWLSTRISCRLTTRLMAKPRGTRWPPCCATVPQTGCFVCPRPAAVRSALRQVTISGCFEKAARRGSERRTSAPAICFRCRKQIAGADVLRSDPRRAAFSKHPEIVTCRNADRTAAGRGHTKHPVWGTVAQQGGHRVPRGFAISRVVSRHEIRVLSQGKLLRLCSIDPLQTATLHEAVDKGAGPRQARANLAGDALSDQKWIVMPYALSAARHAEQRLVRQPLVQALDELLDGLGLIARGREISFELERSLLHEA